MVFTTTASPKLALLHQDVHITLPVFSVAFVLSEDRVSFAILAIVSGLSELPAGSKVCSGKVSVLSNS